MTNNTSQTDLDIQIAALRKVTTKVYLPMLLTGALKFGIVHLVGKKLFPNTFTSVGRTYGIMYLAQLLTNSVKPTKDMRAALSEYKEVSGVAR